MLPVTFSYISYFWFSFLQNLQCLWEFFVFSCCGVELFNRIGRWIQALHNPACSVCRSLPVLMTTLSGSGGFIGKKMKHSLQWDRPTLWAGQLLSLP